MTKITTFRTMHLILQVKVELTKLEVFSVQYAQSIKYLLLLHPLHRALWPRARDVVRPNEPTWYCAAPLGEKSRGNMMAKLSTKYGLSERYTNHTIRVTSIQILEDENIEGGHNIRISEHKSVDSIQNYTRR